MDNPDLVDAFVKEMITDLHDFSAWWMLGNRTEREIFPLLHSREEWEKEFFKWRMERTNRIRKRHDVK